MKLLFRKLIGLISRTIFLSYSSCGRCGRTWNICKGHSTQYTESRGCFPLCEECWEELSIFERLPYYKALWNKWRSSGLPNCNSMSWDMLWTNIERAVMDEH